MKREYNEAMNHIHMSDECAQRILAQASSDGHKGGNIMRFKKTMQRGIAAVAAAVVVSAAAFAADVGGIRTNMSMWFHGEQQQVEVQKDGKYGYTAKIDGEEKSFGGVSFDENGNEQPLSDQDIQDAYAVDVEKGEDGTWTLYFYDQTIDITKDMEQGEYDEVLSHDGEKYRVTVHSDGSFEVGSVDEDTDASAATEK